MAYIACVSFSGTKLSMAKGQIREITDSALIDDLSKAGYIIPYEATDNKSKPSEDKPKTRRKGKAE